MKAFMEFLNNNDHYSSQPIISNHRRVSDLMFHLGIMKIVYLGHRLAKRGLYTQAAWAKSSFDVLRHIEACGGRFYIRGLSTLHEIKKNKQPVVFVANHMSTLENFVLPILLLGFTPIAFVVKRQLTTKYLWFKDIMKAVNPICVDRVNARQDLATILKEGPQVLANGTSVIVFPQSTRSDNFDAKEFNSIGIKLAKKANVPIVPIALKTKFWGNGKIIKDMGPIEREELILFKFGQIYNPENGTTHGEIINFISSTLAIWS